MCVVLTYQHTKELSMSINLDRFRLFSCRPLPYFMKFLQAQMTEIVVRVLYLLCFWSQSVPLGPLLGQLLPYW